MIAFVLFPARMLGQVFQYIGLTESFAQFMIGLPLGKYTVFTIICFMYLVLGCFFDALSMLVLTLPFVTPIIKDPSLPAGKPRMANFGWGNESPDWSR